MPFQLHSLRCDPSELHLDSVASAPMLPVSYLLPKAAGAACEQLMHLCQNLRPSACIMWYYILTEC